MRHPGRRAGVLVAVLVAFAVTITGAGSVPASDSTAAIPGHYIVVLKDSVSAPGAVASEHGRKYGVEASHLYRHALKGYAAKIPAAGLDRLLSDPRVAFVEPDREGSLEAA